MPTVEAEYDGRVFIPRVPLDLPPGTKVEVLLPGPPAELTGTEAREWQEVLHEINSSQPHFPTLEEALRWSRKRP